MIEVTREQEEFKPITIKLNTHEDLFILWDALSYYIDNPCSLSAAREDVIRELKSKLDVYYE